VRSTNVICAAKREKSAAPAAACCANESRPAGSRRGVIHRASAGAPNRAEAQASTVHRPLEIEARAAALPRCSNRTARS